MINNKVGLQSSGIFSQVSTKLKIPHIKIFVDSVAQQVLKQNMVLSPRNHLLHAIKDMAKYHQTPLGLEKALRPIVEEVFQKYSTEMHVELKVEKPNGRLDIVIAASQEGLAAMRPAGKVGEEGAESLLEKIMSDAQSRAKMRGEEFNLLEGEKLLLSEGINMGRVFNVDQEKKGTKMKGFIDAFNFTITDEEFKKIPEKKIIAMAKDKAKKVAIGKEEVEKEVARFDKARQEVIKQMKENATDDPLDFSNMVLMVIEQDEGFLEEIRGVIRKGWSAPTAISKAFLGVKAKFLYLSKELPEEARGIETDPARMLPEVQKSLEGVMERLLDGESVFTRAPMGSVIVSKELSPIDTKKMKSLPSGILVEKGTQNTHAAIYSRFHKIPGIKMKEITEKLKTGDFVIIAGETIIVNPSEETKNMFALYKTQYDSYCAMMSMISLLPMETADGRKLHLLGNMMAGEKTDPLEKAGITELGLVRSEFLNMDEKKAECFPQYLELMEILGGAFPGGAVVRHHDKARYKTKEKGLEGAEYLLEDPEGQGKFAALERAKMIMRVVNPYLKSEVPNIKNAEQIKRFKSKMREIAKKLKAKSGLFNDQIILGAMIENKEAVENIKKIAEEGDFFSFGFNDLIDSLFGVRYGDGDAQKYLMHPDFIMTLMDVIRIVHQEKDEDGLMKKMLACGEVTPLFAMFLYGAGIDGVSADVALQASIKRLCRTMRWEEIQEFSQAVLNMVNPKGEKYVDVSKKEKSDRWQKVQTFFKEKGAELKPREDQIQSQLPSFIHDFMKKEKKQAEDLKASNHVNHLLAEVTHRLAKEGISQKEITEIQVTTIKEIMKIYGGGHIVCMKYELKGKGANRQIRLIHYDPYIETKSRYENWKNASGEKQYSGALFSGEQKAGADSPREKFFMREEGDKPWAVYLKDRGRHPAVINFKNDAKNPEYGTNPENVRDILYLDLGVDPSTGKREMIFIHRWKENVIERRDLIEAEDVMEKLKMLLESIALARRARRAPSRKEG